MPLKNKSRFNFKSIVNFLIVGIVINNIIPSELKAQDTLEWDIFKHERYERELKNHIDSLKCILKNRWALGISQGYLIIPSFIQSEKDETTGVDMSIKKNVTMLSLDYFITQATRLGIQIGYHNAPQNIEISPNLSGGQGMNIDGGGGKNIPLLVFVKTDLRPSKKKSRCACGIKEHSFQNINSPHLFAIGGAGVTYTTLAHVHGNTNVSIRSSLYRQVSFYN